MRISDWSSDVCSSDLPARALMLEDIDMSISENKALVLRAFELLGKRDLPALFALIHEEGSWSVPFDPARFQFGGFRDKAGVMELLTGFLGGFGKLLFHRSNCDGGG